MNGFVFDMDGVLFDTHPAHLQAWRSVLAQGGREVSDSELQFVLDGHKRREILCHFLGDLDDAQAARYGSAKDEYFARLSDTISPVPGILDFVQDVRGSGLRMAVATSAGRSRTEALLTRFGLRDCFAAVVTGDDVCRGKPDPAVYQLAASRLGVPPNDLVAVEDAVSGVKAAVAAGMRCVGIAQQANAERLLRAGAQLVVPDFCGLRADALGALLGRPEMNHPLDNKEGINGRNQSR